jgi:hypothetical protein
LASRRESLKKLDKELKHLSGQVPEGDELFRILTSLADPVHKPEALDRSAAITAAAYVEHGLRKAIKCHLQRNIPTAQEKDLFDGARGGPLGSFHAKIIMAQALGIIWPSQREDLDTIRAIRNAFAHSMNPITFENETIIRLCNELYAFKEMSFISAAGVFGAKGIFIAAVGSHFFKLLIYHPLRDQQGYPILSRPPVPLPPPRALPQK